MSGWVWTPKPDTPLQDSLYWKCPLFNKLQPYENTVNYKWKSRRRFFLLMRSRTSPISSEFRGGGVWTPQTNPLGTPLMMTLLMEIFIHSFIFKNFALRKHKLQSSLCQNFLHSPVISSQHTPHILTVSTSVQMTWSITLIPPTWKNSNFRMRLVLRLLSTRASSGKLPAHCPQSYMISK